MLSNLTKTRYYNEKLLVSGLPKQEYFSKILKCVSVYPNMTNSQNFLSGSVSLSETGFDIGYYGLC
jgi:hypothetical protein